MLKKSFVTLLFLICCQSLYFSLFPTSVKAQKYAGSESLFKKCFESANIEEGIDNLFASDNDNLYITSQHRELISMSRKNLVLNWKYNFGNKISKLLPYENRIYLITESDKKVPGPSSATLNGIVNEYQPENNPDEIDSENKSAPSLLWLINSITGFPIKKVTLPFENVNSLSGVTDGLILTGPERTILFFDFELNLLNKNDEVKEINFLGNLSSPLMPVTYQEHLLIPAGPTIISYQWRLNQTQELLQTKDIITALTINDNTQIIYGDQRGSVYLYNSATKKIDWKYRTGGKILNIVPVKNGVIINSADNFIYLMTSRGSLKWKKRFKNSPVKLLTDNNLIYSLSDQDGIVSIIQPESGKIIATTDDRSGDGIPSSIFLLKNSSTDTSAVLGFKTDRKLLLYYPSSQCQKE